MPHPLTNYVTAPVAIALLALSACSAPGPYVRPDADVPSSYRGGAPTSDSTSVATMPYHEFFTDSTLVVLIDEAVAENLDLQTALKNIEIAEAELGSAKLGRLPVISGGLAASRLFPSANGLTGQMNGTSPENSFNLSVASSWEIDIWNKAGNQEKAAMAAWLGSQESARAVQTRVVASVADTYYLLLALDEQIRVTKQNIDLAETTLRMLTMQYESGYVSSLAVEQERAVLDGLRISLAEYERLVAAGETALNSLCGKMPGPVLRGTPLPMTPVVDTIPAGIPATLLEHRPDVKAAELALREAWSNTDVAKAALFPTLTLTAESGFGSMEANDLFSTPGSLFGSIGGSLLQPIFQQGKLRAAYRKADLRRQQSALAFKQTVITAVGEVSDNLISLDKVRRQEHDGMARVKTLAKGLDDAIILFESGMSTWLEVIRAQQNALEAELDLAEIRRRHLSVIADLYRSLGGGWKASVQAPSEQEVSLAKPAPTKPVP